jgi:hypothetical protein
MTSLLSESRQQNSVLAAVHEAELYNRSPTAIHPPDAAIEAAYTDASSTAQ